MRHSLTALLLAVTLSFTACSSYPDNPKDVALAMCEATKTLNISAMKKYTTKTYGKNLARKMKSFQEALKADNAQAIELKQTHAQISCDDITLTPTIGRIMLVNSASPIIAKMRLQQVNREWKVIQ